ncbi:Clp protease N-terminal domain-containing protein, partial [Acinetobacter baumannii]
MQPNNYTIKAQEAIQQAQQIAFNNDNPTIETEHLLKALLVEKESAIIFLLKKNNVNPVFIESKIDERLQKLP